MNKPWTLDKRTLAAWETTLGPEHPRTDRVRRELACIYVGVGRYEEAERLVAEVVNLQ